MRCRLLLLGGGGKRRCHGRRLLVATGRRVAMAIDASCGGGGGARGKSRRLRLSTACSDRVGGGRRWSSGWVGRAGGTRWGVCGGGEFGRREVAEWPHADCRYARTTRVV